MKTIVITGGIGAGKSLVSSRLRELGIPVYDSDSAVKNIYSRRPDLKAMVCPDIFSNVSALTALEKALYPVLMDDFSVWASSTAADCVGFESAVILQKDFFRGFGDYVLFVDAPEELRRDRVMARGGISAESLERRLALQRSGSVPRNPRISRIILNDGSVENLYSQIDDFLKNINYGQD